MSDPRSFAPEALARFAADWNQHPGLRHMGARIELTTPGVVRAVLDPVGPEHRGGMGTDAVNGPVMAGLFDLTIGLLGYMESGGRRSGVAELHVHFLRPTRGDRVVVEARSSRTGRHLVFGAAELRDANGRICATAEGIVAVVEGRSDRPAF